MKTFSVFILIIVILIGLGFFISVWDSPAAAPAEEPKVIITDPSASGSEVLVGETFAVPGVHQSVELAAGPVDYGEGDNFGTVILLSDFGAGFKLDGADYLAAPIAANTGGSGTFVYITLFEKTASGYAQKNEVLLGDRIEVTDVTYSGRGEVMVDILTRRDDEPMAAPPSVPQTFIFRVEGGRLES